MFKSRTSIAHWLWNHNPFYVISAFLMLYGVRAGYGELDIGTINCWAMMGILGAYTILLAAVAVMIVRWGKVWDDARSILLLILLLFLAVSVSADDLFVKMESAQGGAALMGCAFGFAVAILLGVLKGAGIRLGPLYVVPLVLFLALFFVTPWWCSPELHPKDALTIDWTIFLFPQVAALLLLTLLPAVRMGRRSIDGNGTPWPWPLFPWSAFVFISIAVALRSYALAMTFSPSGPIWISPASRSGIVLDIVWRPYFLVPFALAILILIIESGLTSGNRRVVGRAIATAPLLLLMAWPWSPSVAMQGFLNSLTWTVGSPVWLTVCILVAFYGWCLFRRIAFAETGLIGSVLLLSIVGPSTIDFGTITSINPAPLLVVGISVGILAFLRRSSILFLTAASLATAGIAVLIPETSLAPFRMMTCFHIMLATCLFVSVFWKDLLARRLQAAGATLLVVSAFVAFAGPQSLEIPWEARAGYVIGLSAIGLLCAQISQARVYWTGFLGTIGVFGYSMAATGFRSASLVFGRSATTAFSWSVGTLIIGILISAHKARWLPTISWLNFSEKHTQVPDLDKNIGEANPDFHEPRAD